MKDEQLQVVLGHLRTFERLRAIIAVREYTGLGLREAVDRIEELEREFGLTKEDRKVDMGMDAEVLAIGKFSRNLAKYMDYPEKYYARTQDGVSVVSSLFSAVSTARSCELAEAFGVDPWDFNQHHLNPARADLAKLREFEEEHVEKFEALRDAGFEFYYRPNG
jgi:hypothetical protein